jgi:hypothetical protein
MTAMVYVTKQVTPWTGAIVRAGVLVATNHSNKVGLDDWMEIVERCAKKAGCTVTATEVISPGADDDDYPTFEDGKRPLKVGAVQAESSLPIELARKRPVSSTLAPLRSENCRSESLDSNFAFTFTLYRCEEVAAFTLE